MLNKKEKKEFVRDGYSTKRRINFSQGRNLKRKFAPSLDVYIRFLMDLQKIFSPFVISREKTITDFNKL